MGLQRQVGNVVKKAEVHVPSNHAEFSRFKNSTIVVCPFHFHSDDIPDLPVKIQHLPVLQQRSIDGK